jgi:predicted amidohydrolase YtcJ
MSIFKNGKIITLDSPKIAEAFRVSSWKFEAVGTNEEIMALAEADEEVVDLNGDTVVPGFNDSHMHFLNYAVFKSRVELINVNSISEMISKTKKYIEDNKIPSGQWVISRGWNHNHFVEGRLPIKEDLDVISTDHPIFFSRVCGHIGVANSKALEICNINSLTTVPQGGVMDIEESSPTGILRENAMNLVFDNIPPMDKEAIKTVIKGAFKDALSCGLTTIHTEDLGTAGSLKELIDAYRELDEQNLLPLRFTLQLNLNSLNLIEDAKKLNLKSKAYSHMLNIGLLKLYQDGSLGGRTAAMEEAYVDTATDGVTIYAQETLDSIVLKAHESGFQIAIHAIGDRAMNMILDSYERLKNRYPDEDLRPIIIHCQFTNSEILNRFKTLGVVANVQPSFVMTDWPIVEKAVGKNRALDSYNWKSMLDLGVNVSFSSDAPIENFNPLYGIYAAVTRKDLSGTPEEGFLKDQCLSVEEALKAYTIGSAFMSFEENIKGTISKGKFADFVILSHDILNIEKDKIKDITVVNTYVGGKKVF